MELQQELKLRQTLSQNMILSAKILQMGQLELKEYLEGIVLENPVVDLEETRPESGEENSDFIRRLEELSGMDAQNRQYYQDEEEDARRFEPGTGGQNLQESLTEQMLGLKLDKKDSQIFKYMILNLDDSGYLTCDFPAFCGEMGLSLEEGERIWKNFERMEPKGVGARNLRECLSMQLSGSGGEEHIVLLAGRIIEGYLEELGKNRMEFISRKLKCRLEDVLGASRLIRSCNPRPGGSFGNGSFERYIVPDVLVTETDGAFRIIINDETYPQLRINAYYVSLMKSGESAEAASYIRDKVKQAEWACHCVEQRNRTLYLLAEEILRVQRGFFEGGRGCLVPMTQKAAAEHLGVNESTVSRTVREKYLQCRWGIFPLHFFFSRGTAENENGVMPNQTAHGGKNVSENASAEAVKEKLRRIIEGENKKKPYSDRILSEKLSEAGVSISRRTVAKYRESMGIHDASGRKVFGC